MSVYACWRCGLPDWDGGQGDGVRTCSCPRCKDCGGPPLVCDCALDTWWDDDGDWYGGRPVTDARPSGGVL